MRKEKLLNIGVARDNRGYVITAEYRTGYYVLARFKTVDAAKAALPRVKREYQSRQASLTRSQS